MVAKLHLGSASDGFAGKYAGVLSVPRERILQCAAHLFRNHGYKGTTVRDIADAVGILSGSLFYHFRSKEAILLEIMHEVTISLCSRAEEVLARAASPAERLQLLIDIELEWMVTDVKKDYLGVLVFEWREVSAEAKPKLESLRKHYNNIWLDILAQCHDSAPLRVPIDAAAHILHGALMGAINWYKPSGRYSPEAFRNMLMTLIRQ